ncbi:XdhC family aldehyde oxidoreductase maturation factor [Geosporobacter ferrireducens]|uniref:XdhC family aldehyde oxidoreductase maturation factor n=1 Tax=Geosporobacter ferrireducens TaxID=1424294 RepID=UPI00139BDD73|nr:XdhC/CoxI family protein [Geosporobacter ferrireducens]MTI57777.1 XdhC family protein [Geosporobacter ferrireducens]
MGGIFEWIDESLDKKENFVLATIMKKSGSAPREEGTKMIIKKDFSIDGTIGGGLMEAMTIKLSAKVFHTKKCAIKNFALANKDAELLGMVCGGSVSVLLEYVDCDDEPMIELYKKAVELKKSSIDFVLITKISEGQKKVTGLDKWICTETGFYGLENEEIQKVIKEIRENFNRIKIREMAIEKEKYLIEPFFNYETIYIIGAGHVAQKIADITKNLGFHVVVMDDRKEFANKERFNTADEVKVVPSFDNLADYVKINHNSYIIIVTRGHAYDKDALAQILRTDAKYIGMIGSRNKREYVYNSLLEEGFTYKDLERVYCPIGLHIYADTPGEIAVSIAAELIKVKRGPENEKG